jgi:hypothetical protein
MEIICAPVDEIGDISQVAQNTETSKIENLLKERRKAMKRLGKTIANFSTIPSQNSLAEFFDAYSSAVAHFHLRGTVLHGLETKLKTLLEKYGITYEYIKNYQDFIFGRRKIIVTRFRVEKFEKLIIKARKENAFKQNLKAKEILASLSKNNPKLLKKIVDYAKSYLIVNTESILIDQESVILSVINTIHSALKSAAPLPIKNIYLAIRDLESFISKIPSEERNSFLEFIKLMHDLNFQNEFEHHFQPRIQWKFADALASCFPKINRKQLLSMTKHELLELFST